MQTANAESIENARNCPYPGVAQMEARLTGGHKKALYSQWFPGVSSNKVVIQKNLLFAFVVKTTSHYKLSYIIIK